MEIIPPVGGSAEVQERQVCSYNLGGVGGLCVQKGVVRNIVSFGKHFYPVHN